MIKPIHPAVRHQLSCTAGGYIGRQTKGVLLPGGEVLYSQTRNHCPWCSTISYNSRNITE